MAQDEFFYKTLLDNLYDGVYFVDLEQKITYWNAAAEKITGYSKKDMVNSRCSDNRLRHIDGKGAELCEKGCPLHETLKDGKSREAQDLFLHHKQGHRIPIYIKITPIKDADDKIIGAVEIFNENSAKLEIEKRIKELEKKTTLDTLTRLPNRPYMEKLIRNKLHDFNKTGIPFGLVFIDADDFKSVNDTYGHDAGDRMLNVIAQTLVKNIRPGDMACRWGGEEFVLLFNEVDHGALRTIANKMLNLVRHSDLKTAAGIIKTTVSIGATLVQKSDTLNSLVKRADALMYQSKKAGKNKVSTGR